MSAPPSTPPTPEERARGLMKQFYHVGEMGLERLVVAAIRDTESARDAQARVAQVVAVNEKLDALIGQCEDCAEEMRQGERSDTYRDAADLARGLKEPTP